MKLHVRWFFVEALKFAIILGLFAWIQLRLAETENEVYASTGSIIRGHDEYLERLLRLESIRDQAGQDLARTSIQVEEVRRELNRADADLASEKARLQSLIDDRSGELRDLIRNGIDRLEGTSNTAVERSEVVSQRVQEIEKQLVRSPESMKERMLYPIIQLRGNGTVGSGVVVASYESADGEPCDTYVLTAYHVVLEVMGGAPGSTSVSELRLLEPLADILEAEPRTGELLAANRDADLALLKLELETPWPHVAKPAGPEAMARLNIFDRVYAVGCPLGNKPLPTVGEISSQRKMVSGQNFWMVNAPTFFGNSGGGVFLTDTAELIGISSMIYTYGKRQPMVVPHMGLFVPLSTVRVWLEAEGYGFLLSESVASRTPERSQTGETVQPASSPVPVRD